MIPCFIPVMVRSNFGEGAENCMRGARAPREKNPPLAGNPGYGVGEASAAGVLSGLGEIEISGVDEGVGVGELSGSGVRSGVGEAIDAGEVSGLGEGVVVFDFISDFCSRAEGPAVRAPFDLRSGTRWTETGFGDKEEPLLSTVTVSEA
jgi:hypothetical protein